VRPAPEKPEGGLALHWWRLQRSFGRRWREWRLPRGFERLGTRYGGWWLYAPAIGRESGSKSGSEPLLVDCGLGKDISFPLAFLERFGGRVIGIDPNPDALAYCRAHCPPRMEVRAAALWSEPGQRLTFHLPRSADKLPKGADGVSGSLLASHGYAGDQTLEVSTTSLIEVLASAGRSECDMLKLDIEGAEYDVLRALCADGQIRRTRQLAVEFHHGWTDRTEEDTRTCIAELDSCGFALRHAEGRNHLFVRRDG
jgi:FkbM family methyltransferase